MGGMERLLQEAQVLIDQLRTKPQYEAYVDQHKMKLLDSRLADYDEMLDRGLLR